MTKLFFPLSFLLVLPGASPLDFVFRFFFLQPSFSYPPPALWTLFPGLDIQGSPGTLRFSCPWPPETRSPSQPVNPVQEGTYT